MNEEENKNSTEIVSFDEVKFLYQYDEFDLCFVLEKRFAIKDLKTFLPSDYSKTTSPPPEFL